MKNCTMYLLRVINFQRIACFVSFVWYDFHSYNISKYKKDKSVTLISHIENFTFIQKDALFVRSTIGVSKLTVAPLA